MAISTFEGVVRDGQIRLRDNVQLPEDTAAYVVIPDFAPLPQACVPSPRLIRREQAADFLKRVVKATDDAGV
jgi:hypothetical protein